MQKRVEAIVQELAQKYGLSETVVKAIVESQFQCAREVTKEGVSGNPASFKNIRFKHLGLLVSRPFKILKLDTINGSNLNKSISE